MKLLEGKTAIITGAARGIGKAIAIRFAEAGANIAITDLQLNENTESVVKECEALGVKAKAYASDASNGSQNFNTGDCAVCCANGACGDAVCARSKASTGIQWFRQLCAERFGKDHRHRERR